MTNRHYIEAEKLLNEYIELDAGHQVLNGVRILLEAQVLATLALVDATHRSNGLNVRYAAIGANQGQ